MPNSPSAEPRPSGHVTQFFVLSFAITWCLQLPAVFAKEGILPGNMNVYLPFAVLGIFGPAAAATLLTVREAGRAGLRRLIFGLFEWRAPVRCYLVPLLVPGLLLTGILWLLGLAGREGPVSYFPGTSRFVMAFVIAFGEELGWRGFALPRLQKRVGPFAASGLIGVLWTLWHIPMFVGAGVPLSYLLVLGLLITGGSFVHTWAYNRSGGSLLVAVVAQVGAHVNNSNLALPGDTLPVVVHAIVYAGLGLVLLWPRVATVSARQSLRAMLSPRALATPKP